MSKSLDTKQLVKENQRKAWLQRQRWKESFKQIIIFSLWPL